jgi:heat shock protein HslJ
MRAHPPKSAISVGLAVIACLSVAGCGGSDDDDQTAEASDLRNRTFVSTKDWSGEGSSFSTPVIVRFTDEGGLTWRADCNTAGADVEITADRLRIGKIASTAMGCPEPRQQQDEELSDFFGSDPSWQLDGNRLTLSGGSIEVALQADRSRAGSGRAKPGAFSAGGNTYVFRSRTGSLADRTGRAAEDPVGVIYPPIALIERGGGRKPGSPT